MKESTRVSNGKSHLCVLHTMLNLHCMYLCNGPEDGFG